MKLPTTLLKRILNKNLYKSELVWQKTFHLHCTNLDDSVNLYHTKLQYITEIWVNGRQSYSLEHSAEACGQKTIHHLMSSSAGVWMIVQKVSDPVVQSKCCKLG